MKAIFRFAVTAALVTLPFAGALTAQPLPPPPGGGQPPCWPPPCIPIDGGVGFLLAAGAVLGGRKLITLGKSDPTSV